MLHSFMDGGQMLHTKFQTRKYNKRMKGEIARQKLNLV